MNVLLKTQPIEKTVPLNLLPIGNLFTIPNIKILKPLLNNKGLDKETIFMKTSLNTEILELFTGKLYENEDEVYYDNDEPVIDVTGKYVLQEI